MISAFNWLAFWVLKIAMIISDWWNGSNASGVINYTRSRGKNFKSFDSNYKSKRVKKNIDPYGKRYYNKLQRSNNAAKQKASK